MGSIPLKRCKMNFGKTLQTITEIVSQYEQGAYVTKDTLLEAHRQLTANMYFLTKFQIDFKSDWQVKYYTSKENSNAAKERDADDQVPELYMCRKILEAAKGVSIAMGYEIQMIKNES